MGVKRVGHDWVTFTYTGEEQINVKKVLTRNKQNKIHYTYSTWKSNKRFFSVFLSLRHLFTFHFYFYFINFPFLLLLSFFIIPNISQMSEFLWNPAVVTFQCWGDKLHISFSWLAKVFWEIFSTFPVFQPISFYFIEVPTLLLLSISSNMYGMSAKSSGLRANIKHESRNSAICSGSILKKNVGQAQ